MTELEIRPWGCTTCGSHGPCPVIETGADEDGFVVRRRRCQACHAEWETEERPLAPGAYWARAASRNTARRARYHGHTRKCAKCGADYISGYWRQHVVRSTAHAASLKKPANRAKDRDRVRRYQREWARRSRAA